MLERSLTYHLASIAEDGIGNANRIFEVRFGWSVRELRVLRLVRAQPGVTFTALAAMTKFERSLTSRIVTRLIRAGLIARAGSAADARRFTLTATPEGDALCARADPLTADLERLMLAPLAESERAAFMEMAGRVRAWVQGGYVGAVAEQYPEVRARRAAGARAQRESGPG